jgi:protein-L-isoaspartate(D-aspartate) O-methyltransferase
MVASTGDARLEQLRQRMVTEQLEGRDIRDARVLAAFRRIPRHLFVPGQSPELAYEDHPLAIGGGQTISQPYMVASMTQALQLRGGEKVLEVGSGSGYQAAILKALGANVYTVERLPELSAQARRQAEQAGQTGIHYRVADGSRGWPEEAPFERIIVTAGAPSVPGSLVEQLVDGGRMVIPVGGTETQELLLLRRELETVTQERICTCSFVKLRGAEGW